MNINLREEETVQYISLYQRYLEEVQSLNNKVMNVLNEVMQQSKYDKLQNQVAGLIDAYMEIIVNNIKTGVFQTWQESDGSLRACLRTYRAGYAADEVCAQIEQQMEDLMHNILKIEKADMIVTERPVVSEDGLEQLEDICRTAQTEIQNIKTEYTSQVLSKESDNDIYATLRPLIEGVATNMEAFFEASLNSFVELHEFVKNISAQLHNIAEESNINIGDGKEKKHDSKETMNLSSGDKHICGNDELCGKADDEEIFPDDFDEDKLKKLLSAFHSFLFMSKCLMIQVNKSFRNQEIGSKLDELYSTFEHEMLVIRSLDYVQVYSGEVAKVEDSDMQLIIKVQDNYASFCAKKESAEERHRYSKLIKGLDTEDLINTSELKEVNKDIDYWIHKQFALFKEMYDTLSKILEFDIVLNDYVIELYEIVSNCIKKYYYNVANIVGTDVKYEKLKELKKSQSRDGVNKPKSEKKVPCPYSVGIDALLEEHFEDTSKKGKRVGKLKSNVQYYYTITGHSENYNDATSYYNYETDDTGRIVHAYTEQLLLKNTKGRIAKSSDTAEVGRLGWKRESRYDYGDDGGHIFRDAFGGSQYIDNLLPQHEAINRRPSDPQKRKMYRGGQWFRLEELWSNYLKDSRVNYVSVDIMIEYDKDNLTVRPNRYHVVTHVFFMDGTDTYKDFAIRNDKVVSLSKNRKNI